jgi:hypothetical protein
MPETLTIVINKKNAYKVLQGLAEKKAITVVNDPFINLSPKKKKQAKEFLSALQEAKLAEQGKIKLKTFDQLLKEI